MLSKLEWLECIKKVIPRSSQWSPTTIKATYGSYKAHIESGDWTEGTIHFKANLWYMEDGTTRQSDGSPVEVIEEPKPIVTASEVEDFEELVAKKYLHIKSSAKQRGKDFDLDLATVRRILKRKTCYYTGLPIGITLDSQNPNQFTFDRVNPELGYVKGNVVACSNIANQFKSKIEHEFSGIMSRKKQLEMIIKMFK